jgi:cell division protein FtsL
MERLKQNKLAAALIATLIIILIVFLIIAIPIIKRDYEVKRLKYDIQWFNERIEFNKQEWNNCYTNMELRHDENEQNRKILNELMQQYNDMVGFTKASDDNRVSPTEQVDLTGTISDT